jgi:hypothetical protein
MIPISVNVLTMRLRLLTIRCRPPAILWISEVVEGNQGRWKRSEPEIQMGSPGLFVPINRLDPETLDPSQSPKGGVRR